MTNDIALLNELSDQEVTEMKERGYALNVIVEISDNTRYVLDFYTIHSLTDDLAYAVNLDRQYVSYVALIILPEVTVQDMHIVIKRLVADKFFSQLKCLNPDEYRNIECITFAVE